MKILHSPGPWVIRQFDYVEVTDADGLAVASNEMYYPAALKPENAPIISAAPDMLAALQMLDERLQAAWKDGSLPASVLTGAEVSQYCAAILKATTPLKVTP